MMMTRGSSVVERESHNLVAAGSTPAPAIAGTQVARTIGLSGVARWCKRTSDLRIGMSSVANCKGLSS